MNYAVIAAGEGSRLSNEGITVAKPLIPIAGVPMIERLLDIFEHNNPTTVSVITRPDIDLSAYSSTCAVIHASTPSSMHSLHELSRFIPEGRVIVTTVDTIFRSEDFSRYVRMCESLAQGEALFVVTPFVDDETPLWVEVASELKVTGFFDNESDMSSSASRLVSGGIYCFDTATAWPVLNDCIEAGEFRMRNFQRALIRSGVTVRAFVFDKVFDIDHVSDIQKANQWLNS